MKHLDRYDVTLLVLLVITVMITVFSIVRLTLLQPSKKKCEPCEPMVVKIHYVCPICGTSLSLQGQFQQAEGREELNETMPVFNHELTASEHEDIFNKLKGE